MITSTANPKVRFAIKLRESRIRRRERLFLIDGLREIERALAGGIVIEQLFLDVEKRETLPASLRGLERVTLPVSRNVFEKIAFGDRNEHCLAVAHEPARSLALLEDRLKNKAAPLIGILTGIEKPGNIGAVFRSADGAGLDALILADPGCDLFNPAAVRASLGTLFHVPSTTVSSRETLDWLRQNGFQVLTARCDAGSRSYETVDYRPATAIVLGSEAEGLDEHWDGEEITAIHLPMCGNADSLNVSNAAAVLFYFARFMRSR